MDRLYGQLPVPRSYRPVLRSYRRSLLNGLTCHIELVVTMTKDPFIVIVDDDDALRGSLDNLIRSVGYRTKGFRPPRRFCSLITCMTRHALIADVQNGSYGRDLTCNERSWPPNGRSRSFS